MLIVAIVLGAINAGAQTTKVSEKKASDWEEIQVVDIPQGVDIQWGTTKSGNPKAWIVVSGMNVSIPPSSAKKFQAGETQLVLVKWKNKETGKLKYSTRQKSSSRTSNIKDVDLTKVF